MRVVFVIISCYLVTAKPYCLTCQYEIDHNGIEQPGSDPGCFDDEKVSEEYSEECSSEIDVCLLSIKVEWVGNGRQTTVVTRGCGQVQDAFPGDGCMGNFDLVPTPMKIYKECNSMCFTSNGFRVFNVKFWIQ